MIIYKCNYYILIKLKFIPDLIKLLLILIYILMRDLISKICTINYIYKYKINIKNFDYKIHN